MPACFRHATDILFINNFKMKTNKQTIKQTIKTNNKNEQTVVNSGFNFNL